MSHYMKQGTILLLAATCLVFAGPIEESVAAPELARNERGVAADVDATWPPGRSNETTTNPFEANFFTDLAGLTPDPKCGDPAENRVLNTQEGEGEATHLGRFSVQITFCVDSSALVDADSPGELTAGESIPYWDGLGTFTAANGDELWITISGEVLPSDVPDFDFEFADPFEVSGGTGRFEGASGSGITNSLVDFQSAPSRTQHRWAGTLILSPGN